MPGSTVLFQTDQDEEEGKDSEVCVTSKRQPPPVPARAASVTLQSWHSVTSVSDNYGDNKHARSSSMDSLESSGSSSSSGGYNTSTHRVGDAGVGEYIPTRNAGKVTKLPSHNPLQFVKVQSPLYKKAEQQIKLTKEVKICREALKEGEEEWQSNLDNWKSRRRKVTEKVLQRAEEIKQIEQEEQLRHEQALLQQRKIKKFSEIVERRGSRSYNLDLYIGQGDDSGLGGTPEPDEVIDSQSSILRSDTSEGMTSEAESIDSDTHKPEKIHEKDSLILSQNSQSWLKRHSFSTSSHNSSTCGTLSEMTDKTGHSFDINSSTEPSDIEAQVGDSETISSEEDISFGDNKSDDVESTSQSVEVDTNEVTNDHFSPTTKQSDLISTESNLEAKEDCKSNQSSLMENQINHQSHSFKIHIKPGDNKGFGFCVKGGKDLGCAPYVESVSTDGAAYMLGLEEGDEIVTLNGELACTYSHASLIFAIKQAVYTGVLDIEVSRTMKSDINDTSTKVANRKSSFAEKLALFSSGSNQNTEKTKSAQFTKPDGKKESLVLRRRSAFETNMPENVIQRRSSCLIQETFKENHKNIEKRHSMDFSLQSNFKKNGVKKDVPPPVPAKPKLKAKQAMNFEINSYKCDNSSPTNNDIDTQQFSNDSARKDLSVESTCSSSNQDLNVIENKVDKDDFNVVKNDSCQVDQACDLSGFQILESFSNINISDKTISDSLINECLFTNQTNSDDADQKDFLNDCIVETMTHVNKKADCVDIGADVNDSISGQMLSADISFPNDIVQETPLKEVISPIEKLTEIPDKVLYAENICENIHSLDSSKDSFSVNETYQSHLNELDECNYQSESSIANHDEKIDSFEEAFEDEAVLIKSENTENTSVVESVEENVTVVHVNPSPLCLSLEKNDEDDAISASTTTTSSETPDTETVIETLPLNLSPLPSDESNGEDPSKISASKDQISDLHSVEVVCESTASMLIVDDNIEIPESSKITDLIEDPNQYNSVPDSNSLAIIDEVFVDEQDEEYQRELDESLDQITALDVIDEMEHRLMQQLEHQDDNDNFEEISESLTFQLENDLNQEWMYYSEADLLDYVPQNREPPREPPPPPPIEPEINEEEKPLTRVNSTKRIKKEIWRRRSDFLGLDSSEGIDIDNILPPPPGLEEILKLEREQNQWLEKRLSLVEPELSDTISTKSSCLDTTQDFTLADYSNYLYEEEDSKPGLEASSDTFEVEQMFEADDSQFSDTPVPVSDESTKAKESPQNKAKQMINSLGAAPKAKIMDSNKWITEKIAPQISKKPPEPLFRQASYDQNYWIAQDAGRKRTQQSDVPNRRYSMTSHSSNHPDVTLRTWDDRENDFLKKRHLSAVWNSSNPDSFSDTPSCLKQDELHSHNLCDDDEMRCDTDILESEMHQCSCCGKGLCEGSAMGIEALRLYFHIECFRCCMCQMLLGNGMSGTDVQVKNNQLYCSNCFTVD